MPKLARGKVETKVGTTVADLVSDWFDRDPVNFTKVSAEHRIEWGEGESHSAFILKGRPRGWDMLEQSYNVVKSLLTAMALPYRFTLRFHKDSSFTDGRVIYVSTQALDEADKTIEQRFDIVLGLAAHEGCHVKYTDFKLLNEWADTLPKEESRHILWIQNVLEDERIEQELGADMPGLVRYLIPLKKYMFEELYEREKKKLFEERKKSSEAAYRAALRKALDAGTELPEKPDAVEVRNPFERLMSTFISIIRYPKNIDPEDIKFFGKYILDVKEIITPYPASSEEVHTAAEKIWQVFKNFYEAPPKKEEPDEEKEGPRVFVVTGKGGESGEEIEVRPDDIIIDLTDPDNPVDSDILTDAKKMLDLVEGLLKKSSEAGEPFGGMSVEVVRHDFKMSVIEGDAFAGTVGDVHFRKAPNNEAVYREAVRTIAPNIAPLKKALQLHNQQFVRTLRGMRSGELDVAKLVEGYMGVPTVHLQHQRVRTDNVAIGVLMDQSGSMGSRNMRAAREGAILLTEALKNISNIELFVYGHTADITSSHSTDLYVYREPGYAPKFSIGSAVAISQNRDGTAIYETARRMRMFSKVNGVLFVLSDGAPCAEGYYGPSANANTRDCVRKATALGFTVVQIAIATSVPSAEMFDHYVTFTDMGQLARQMGMLVKSLAMKKAKTHIDG